MARKKVSLQWIANDATRRATLKKRRKGLMKKARELATLCDIDACVVVYGEDEPTQPEVWPSAPEAAHVVARFKAMPELDQYKKMMNQEEFLQQRIAKLQDQLHKAERDNRERETTLLLHDAIAGRRPGLVGLNIEQLTSLGWMVEMRFKSVNNRIEYLRGQGLSAPAPAPQPLLPAPMPLVVPYATGDTDVGAPYQEGWPMDVVQGGGDLGAVVYSGFGGGNGSYGSAGAGCDMMQFGNMGAGLAWADPGPSFPPM